MGHLTPFEAAKALGVRWRSVEPHLVRWGWLVDVGRGKLATTHLGVSGGYLAAAVAPHRMDVGDGRTVSVETEYFITAAGMIRLRQELAAI